MGKIERREPKVSICIPCYNRTEVWFNAIKMHMDYAEGIDYEIVTSHNGSRPRGFVYTTNLVSNAARGDIIVQCNDDCIVTEGWLPPLIKAIEEEGYASASPTTYTDPVEMIKYEVPFAPWCLAVTRRAWDLSEGHSMIYFQNSSEWIWMNKLLKMYGVDRYHKLCQDSIVYHEGMGKLRSANWLGLHEYYQSQVQADAHDESRHP